MKIFFVILLSVSPVLFAQSDWTKWEAAKPSFKIPVETDNENGKSNGTATDKILTGARQLYAFFISDLDGDNCPFYPSCSHFFVRAVRATNLLQGALMFADRFVRDTNFLKDPAQYPVKIKHRFYDPVFLYDLNISENDIRKFRFPQDEN